VDALTLETEDFLSRTRLLARLVPLRHLALRGAGGRGSALAAAPDLKGIEALDFIDYFDAPLKAADAGALAASPYLGRLKALHLYRNDVGDAGLQALAAAPWLRGLEVLNLAENGLSDAGVRTLAESPHLERLRFLDLRENSVGDPGAAALAASPALEGLAALRLSSSRELTAAGQDVLRRRFGSRVRFSSP
jgi:Ran GTPase-activating protein (RanGAP) involved in mRNA processing and transport